MAAYDYPLLIQHLLESGRARAGDCQIVSADGSRLGYEDLARRVRKLGSGLRNLGVRHGDVIAVLDWDTRRYLECFFAVPALGATLQTVNVRLSLEQIAYTLNETRASTLLFSSEFADSVSRLLPHLEHVERLVYMSDRDSPLQMAGASRTYESVVASGNEAHVFEDFAEDTRATVFFTTGTTGLPKGVWFSHRQIVLHTLALLSAFAMSSKARFSADAVYMPMTPMFHVHAWGFPFAATLAGIKQVYPGKYSPGTLLSLIASEGVTLSHCVPTIVRMLLDDVTSGTCDLSKLSLAVGGSALPTSLAQQALSRGIDIFAGYGMSESCPVLTLSLDRTPMKSDEAEVKRRVTAGTPVPLVQLALLDECGARQPQDGVATGEVAARAPWLTKSYLNDQAATEALWNGGYLHTRDIGKIDTNGELAITDRLKDVIKSGGEWISSLQLEEIISMHPGVAEVAVIGVPDEKWGERALPFVVAKAGVSLAEAEILGMLAQSISEGELSSFAAPKSVVFKAQIPKTSVGKPDKKALRSVS